MLVMRQFSWPAGIALAFFSLGKAAEENDNLSKYNVTAPGITASYIAYGARLTNLYVDDKHGVAQDVVLGLGPSVSSHRSPGPNRETETGVDGGGMSVDGAIVGRYAGRMKNGTFSLDGQSTHVTENENDGYDSLHGGKIGYDQRNWTLVSHNQTTITFMLEDDGFEGYPGRVVNYATFSVAPANATADGPSLTSRLVSIPLDEPTPIMLTTHPYFNLNAFVDPTRPDVLDHTLHMPYSQRYVEIDNIEVATGQLGVVDGSGGDSLLDFTSPATFGRSIDANVQECGFNCTGIDTNFIIDRPRAAGDGSAALSVLSLSSNITGIKFDLYTNQQALIVYTCNKLTGSIPLKQSQQHSPNGSTVSAMEHGCVAIETQGWIDGVNHPEWGQQEFQVYTPNSQPAVMWAKYVFGLV